MQNQDINIQDYYVDISEVTRHQNLQIIREQRMKLQNTLSDIAELDLKKQEINEAFKKLIAIRALKSDLYDLKQEIRTLDDPQAQVRQQEEIDTISLIIEQIEANLRVALDEIMPFRIQMEEYLNSINRNHLQEIRAIRNPAEPIRQVLSAIEQLTGNVLMVAYQTERRQIQRSQQVEPQAYLHALLHLDLDNISPGKIVSAREFFNNTNEDRTRAASYAARALYQWLQVFFQMHAISQSQAPVRAQLQATKAQRDQLINLQLKNAQQLQTLLADKNNLETQINEMQNQQQSWESENAKLIWLVSTNQLLIDLERSLEGNSNQGTSQQNDYKSINLDHLSFDDTPAHQLMLRLFKIHTAIATESGAYEENYQLFCELSDKEVRKQNQISDFQSAIETGQSEITCSESQINKHKANSQTVANEISATEQRIKITKQRQKEISQKLSQPVCPQLRSSHILKIKSQDPSKQTYELIKLVLLSLNRGHQTWTDFMHSASQIYLSMKTTKLQNYKLNSILEIKQFLHLSKERIKFQRNSPEFVLQNWLNMLVEHEHTFQSYNNEVIRLKQLQEQLQQLQQEQQSIKYSLEQEQQNLKVLKSTLQQNQQETKKIKDSCNTNISFFQQLLEKYNQEYVAYFKNAKSFTMKAILLLFHNSPSTNQIKTIVQILEYNTYSSQFLKFVYDFYVLDPKQKKQDVKLLEEKCLIIHEKFKDFEISKEAKQYSNIEKSQQRFLIEYCFKFQEIKRSYEFVIEK